MRIPCALLASLFLAVPVVRAGGDGLTGNWKVSFFEQGARLEAWLLKIEQKDGKVKGTVEAAKGVPNSTLDGIRLDGQLLTFTIKLQGRPFTFEALVPKAAAKTLSGSMQAGRQLLPARLEATKLEALEFKEPRPEPITFAAAKEMIGKQTDDPLLFDAATVLLRNAKKEGAKAEEVKSWAVTALKAADAYGPRWQREIVFRVAERLASDDYPTLGEEFARRAVDALGPKAGAEDQLRGLSLLATALKKTGKQEEVKALTKRIDTLEEEGHKANLKDLPFTPEKFGGRSGKANRVVLVELFTGAQCPPCVAADLAFDGLEQTYKPSEVVLLQYHLHIPGPDALTNPDSEARQTYYGPGVRGTPSIFFNGKSEAGGGGFREHAEGKYKQYLEVIAPKLKESAAAKIDASAMRKGDKVEITASVSDVEKPGEKVKLRLALVEEWVRYVGGNGLAYHSNVVRAFPGGAAGLALPKGTGKQTATVDLEDLRRSLNDYLDKSGRPFRDAQRPMRFRSLRLIAFVQNDETNEVLHAVEVHVK